MIREQFLNTIRKFRMIEKNDTVFVAVSGGGDSVVLFHLLYELSHLWKLKLGILHVNHKLRGKASDRDELFVKQLASRFKVPFYATQINVKEKAKRENTSLEEAARDARLDFFHRISKEKRITKLALAHNQDDQAETVLMRIITGTGLQGLQAIRPKLSFRRKPESRDGRWTPASAGVTISFIRPLIEVSREHIRQFAKKNSISFREDRSNRATKFLRNRIRLELIPFIEKRFNPKVKHALSRLPNVLDVDLSFLNKTAETFFKKYAHKKTNEISFQKKLFLKLDPAIQFRLIGKAMNMMDSAELTYEHWNSFLELLAKKSSFKLQFPKSLFVEMKGNIICISRTPKPVSFRKSISKNESKYIPEINCTIGCELLKKKPSKIRKNGNQFDLFDAEKLNFPLSVRNRKPGDRFQPLGQSKPIKLKKFLINRRIPQEERDFLPLVLSNQKIAWIAGVGMSDAFKAEPKTRQFARLSVALGNRP